VNVEINHAGSPSNLRAFVRVAGITEEASGAAGQFEDAVR
jgi:hypothetical protein